MLSIGIDTGGTYTDAVLFDPAKGVLAKAKALTTKHDLALGIGEALLKVLPADPKSITLVSLSTTLATNALVEGHGNPVGLLLLGYPIAALERAGLREALRGDPVAFITGGHNGLGEEQAPLDLEAARKAILEQAPLVQSFAVAGFFAVRNPRHELQVRDLVRELTAKPVTCAHELSSNLDAPRRALTAVLNARLIPQLDLLIRAVQGLMAAHDLKAPLMVVKGDGSLIADSMALTSPVETILSGPAASVVGAQHLAGNVDCFVSDIGGTTTDIAVLRQGRPVLNREGATVGGFRTMVEAVAVHTFGLGGDSEVRFDGKKLLVGPRRAVPLSLLAKQFPKMLEILREQAEAELPVPRAARFALRLRRLPGDAHLKPAERAVWDALEGGPQPLSKLAANYLAARALDRLMDRGLAIASTITPSDAAHLLGKQSGWVTEAAELGAKILCREVNNWTPSELAEAVYDRVVALTGEYLLESALAEENQPWERPAGLSRWLLDRGLTKPSGQGVGLAFRLDRPVVAIGAPAGTYYDEVALRLNTRAIIPADGDVCNAVGAVASGIVQRCKIIISQPVEGIYRAHMPDGIRDFHDLEPAAAAAQTEARKEAERLAILAGAGTLRLEESRQDVITQTSDGLRTFIECVIVATAAGRPRLAVR